jgi:U4/U6.U5 tri-snRNP-associated protein 2
MHAWSVGSTIKVFKCLIIGRGVYTHAYSHSIQDDHHVFINLESLKVYVLPDGYEVKDSSLNDIKVQNGC